MITEIFQKEKKYAKTESWKKTGKTVIRAKFKSKHLEVIEAQNSKFRWYQEKLRKISVKHGKFYIGFFYEKNNSLGMTILEIIDRQSF